jgi:hypothetical protein
MNQDAIDQALKLFDLVVPLTQEQLDQKRSELLALWQPHRYANLTNNPRKYMQMYKKGEAMIKEIQAAYDLLSAWLASQKNVKR